MMGMFNYVFPFWCFWSSRARDLFPAAPDNSKTRKTNKNNKIMFLRFISRLSLGMKNPKTPKTKQLENNTCNF